MTSATSSGEIVGRSVGLRCDDHSLYHRLVLGELRVDRQVHRPAGEVGGDDSGLDDLHLHADCAELEVEGFGQAFHCELGAVTWGTERHRDRAAHRRHVDDRSRTALSYLREDGLGDIEETDHVGLELGTIFSREVDSSGPYAPPRAFNGSSRVDSAWGSRIAATTFHPLAARCLTVARPTSVDVPVMSAVDVVCDPRGMAI